MLISGANPHLFFASLIAAAFCASVVRFTDPVSSEVTQHLTDLGQAENDAPVCDWYDQLSIQDRTLGSESRMLTRRIG